MSGSNVVSLQCLAAYSYNSHTWVNICYGAGAGAGAGEGEGSGEIEGEREGAGAEEGVGA